MAKKKRFIDNEEVRKTLADLHLKQLEVLMERVEDGTIEPQEMRLIWDMVKTHSIGIETIDELVAKSLEDASADIDDIEFDPEFEFNG